MSDKTQNEENHPVNAEGLKVIGTPDDTKRFGKGDYVQAHLEMRGQVFLNYPHGERGVVIELFHKDDEHYYHMPVIQFTNEIRMFNPDHVIVVQKADGTPGEVERLKLGEEKTAAEKLKTETEKEPA